MKRLKMHKTAYVVVLWSHGTDFDMEVEVLPNRIAAKEHLESQFIEALADRFKNDDITLDNLDQWAKENNCEYCLTDSYAYFSDYNNMDIQGEVYEREIDFYVNVSLSDN